MNWNHIEGKWKEFRGELRQEWGKLTDDDLDVVAGKREALVGRLQQRYGYEKDRAEGAIDRFLARFDVNPDPGTKKSSTH